MPVDMPDQTAPGENVACAELHLFTSRPHTSPRDWLVAACTSRELKCRGAGQMFFRSNTCAAPRERCRGVA